MSSMGNARKPDRAPGEHDILCFHCGEALTRRVGERWPSLHRHRKRSVRFGRRRRKWYVARYAKQGLGR